MSRPFLPILLLLLLRLQTSRCSSSEHGDVLQSEFATTRGAEFVVRGGGEAFYPHGFNAYWLMHRASAAASSAERRKVTVALQQASALGLNLVRTWAFSDGGYLALQCSPGAYDQQMFQGLDFVIGEARKYGIRVILSLVNGNTDFGGRRQYVEWAKNLGSQHHLASDDDFYTNQVAKQYFKDHIKTVLTRINTVTGTAYRDEPFIFAWELINEPRCPTDPSGNTLQAWITEMAAYVKSVDPNHLLEVGLEGFYGESAGNRRRFNPAAAYDGLGSDFISNNLVPGIDFATIHAYPDQWMAGSSDEAQLEFLRRWITSHIYDATAILQKPLLIAEFGKSHANITARRSSATTTSGSRVKKQRRDAVFTTVYDIAYESIARGGGATGVAFWQLLLGNGMDGLRDGYEVVVSESPSTASIIARHSANLHNITTTSSRRQYM